MPGLPQGPIDGQGGGRKSKNDRVTVAALTDTPILNENPSRIYAIIQNQSDTTYINISLSKNFGSATPSIGITLYPHDVLILKELDKGRCEWTGAVSGMPLGNTYVGVIEVENA